MASSPPSKAIGVVVERLGARDLRDALLAGVLGTLGGWAVFLLWLEERDHSRTFLISLAVAAVVALALEYLREVIREGHGELERRAFWSVGVAVVALVLMCELFAKAYAHLAKTVNLLPSVLTVLLGSATADTLDPWWALIGLLGIWAYMGVVAARGGRPVAGRHCSGDEQP
jgi:hypothetical protein